MMATESYKGSKAFTGSFCTEDALQAGFCSDLNPPEVGEQVVCFFENQLNMWGEVVGMKNMVSDGTMGLDKGCEGIMVTLKAVDGTTFSAWSAFLAPINDKDYSSICTPAEFQASSFNCLWP